MKVKPIIKRENINNCEPISNTHDENDCVFVKEDTGKTIRKSDMPSLDICIRCKCKNESDLKKLNDIIHKFNSTQIDISKRALVQSGREFDNGALCITITIMSADDDDIDKEEFQSYNFYLYKELYSAKIDFLFINFEKSIKNVADVMAFADNKNDERILIMDRYNMPKDVFDFMCQYIMPGVDHNYIEAIRIPHSQITVTADCKWNLAENNDFGKSDEQDKTDTIKITICIFDIEYSKLFDVLVREFGKYCIKNIIAEYEEDENNYFRTTHIELDNNSKYTKPFIETCENLGVVQYIGK